MKRINIKSSFGAAVASAILQGATILALFAFKKLYSDEAFSSLIALMAWASIIGSGATFRLEFLLLQRFKEVNKASLLVTFTFAIGVVSLATALLAVAASVFAVHAPATFYIFVLSLGYGMVEAQSFLSVQLDRAHELVYSRLAQAAGTALAVLLGLLGYGFDTAITTFALSVTLPSLVWVLFAVRRAPGKAALFFPDRHLLARGLSLTVATTVNTLYVSLAIIVAGHTQSASFVADFGFAQKLLTGPITFIRHFYSHAFLSNVLRLKDDDPSATDSVWHYTRSTVLRSMATYLPFAMIVVLFSALAPDIIGIANPSVVFLLAIVTFFQSGVNSIAGVRAPLHRDRVFLVLDVFRLVVLAAALIAPVAFSYSLRFSITSAVLYLSYIAFVRQQIYRST